MKQQPELDGDYWSNRYKDNEDPWDMGKISPPLKGYFDQLNDNNISILIPGCGNAHEAEYLLQQGFNNITLIDIAPFLVEEIKKRLSVFSERVTIICGDFFELDRKFNLIIEQTFFCAIDPLLREKYVAKMYDLLEEKGKLVGVMFNKEFPGGPPFSGSIAEYEKLFSEKFNILKMEECYNSVAPRSGAEVFVIFQKK